ncbi:hypothetical protein RhiJN_17591 [Ceratobasidium sp. AG-Ba]|nr:hypothetical protein RhiJN_17591 [Ceratobasidium sp. AG-Ba]
MAANLNPVLAGITILGFAVGLCNAQQPLYGQCGGIGWTGGTSCVSGSTCVKVNDYYSQCLAGSSSPTVTSSAPQPTGSGPTHLVGKTPALGWNSWNAYRCDINDAKVRAAANQFVSLGLKDAGYKYVNIDDCWSDINGRDGSTKRIKPDANKFPNGISGTASYVHSLGLSIGIYSDAGTKTCAGYPGSLGYETIDAQTWAEWGIDYLKYDNCNVPGNWSDNNNVPSNYDWYNSNSALRYRQMTNALNSVVSKRVMEFDICIWGNANVWTWGGRVGHSWPKNVKYLNYIDFWAHNDMDMMEIGNGALTINEQRTHFAMWVALKSPILLGTDLSKLSSTQLSIIKNAELLAFSQDTTIAAPAKPYKSNTTPPEFYAGKSVKGTHVFIINTGSSAASKVVTFSEVTGLTCTSCKVHDMWTGKDLGTFTGSYTLTVGTHDTAALLLT